LDFLTRDPPKTPKIRAGIGYAGRVKTVRVCGSDFTLIARSGAGEVKKRRESERRELERSETVEGVMSGWIRNHYKPTKPTKQKSLQTHKTKIKNHYKSIKPTKQKSLQTHKIF
jgi:hypothetical protein